MTSGIAIVGPVVMMMNPLSAASVPARVGLTASPGGVIGDFAGKDGDAGTAGTPSVPAFHFVV